MRSSHGSSCELVVKGVMGCSYWGQFLKATGNGVPSFATKPYLTKKGVQYERNPGVCFSTHDGHLSIR